MMAVQSEALLGTEMHGQGCTIEGHTLKGL
jgi:hypothetical protein